MKTFTAIVITNVCIIFLSLFVCWITKSGWGMIALFFSLQVVQNEKLRNTEIRISNMHHAWR